MGESQIYAGTSRKLALPEVPSNRRIALSILPSLLSDYYSGPNEDTDFYIFVS
jgi:hypothetical protein